MMNSCPFPFTLSQNLPCCRTTSRSNDKYDRASSPLYELLVQNIVGPITERWLSSSLAPTQVICLGLCCSKDFWWKSGLLVRPITKRLSARKPIRTPGIFLLLLWFHSKVRGLGNCWFWHWILQYDQWFADWSKIDILSAYFRWLSWEAVY